MIEKETSGDLEKLFVEILKVNIVIHLCSMQWCGTQWLILKNIFVFMFSVSAMKKMSFIRSKSNVMQLICSR